MKITINPYDGKSIHDALKAVVQYKSWLVLKEKQLLEKLAFMGATRVSLGFARAVYKGDTDITISTRVTGNTAIIQANGEQVAFIEFGAGVRFGYGYQGTRPEGIVGIGEYGKGKGKNPKGWWYTGANGSEHTYGNPPAQALYTTVVELAESITDIAKEVFRS